MRTYAHSVLKMSPKQRFNINLATAYVDALLEIKDRAGRSASESIALALDAYLPEALREARTKGTKLQRWAANIETLERSLGKKKADRKRATTRKRS
jgi:hypothetical protein